jgi:hypothetical protein
VDQHHVEADPDPDSSYHLDADPESDFYLMRIRIRLFSLIRMRIRIRIQILASTRLKLWKKCSKRLIFHTFWLVICKFMRIRFRIQLNTDADPNPDFYLMRMRIQVAKMMRIHNTDLRGGYHERFFGRAYLPFRLELRLGQLLPGCHQPPACREVIKALLRKQKDLQFYVIRHFFGSKL